MNIEERLDRLDKQNQNLRRGLVGLLLLVLVVPFAAFVWQDKQPKVLATDIVKAGTLYAKALYIRDKVDKGPMRATLSAHKDYVAFTMHDRKGACRFSIKYLDSGLTSILMQDADEKPVLSLAAAEKGRRSGLALYDGQHEGVVLGSHGHARGLFFNDSAGLPRFVVRHTADDTKLGFFNGDLTQPRVALGIQYDAGGKTRHDLWDKDGNPLKWDK